MMDTNGCCLRWPALVVKFFQSGRIRISEGIAEYSGKGHGDVSAGVFFNWHFKVMCIICITIAKHHLTSISTFV